MSDDGHIQSWFRQVTVLWSCDHHGLQPNGVRELMLHSMALLLETHKGDVIKKV